MFFDLGERGRKIPSYHTDLKNAHITLVKSGLKKVFFAIRQIFQW
jgi:hypothetical protein